MLALICKNDRFILWALSENAPGLTPRYDRCPVPDRAPVDAQPRLGPLRGCRAVELHSAGRRAGDKPESGPQTVESPGQRRARPIELWPRWRHPPWPPGERDHLARNLQRRARREEPLGAPGGAPPVSRELQRRALFRRSGRHGG